jgi:hypothetical protein
MVRLLLRPIEAIDLHKGGLALLGVAASALAEGFARRGSVQNIVHYLKA